MKQYKSDKPLRVDRPGVTAGAEKAEKTERHMRKFLVRLSVIVMVLCPILLDFGLAWFSTYVDTDLSVFYPSTAMTAFQWGLDYLSMILGCICHYAGYAIMGYSIMRFGVKKSPAPILLALVSVTIRYAGGVVSTVYAVGSVYVRENLSRLLIIWITNYLLGLFTVLCALFLCAMLRASFRREGALRVSLSREEKAQKKQNVLRRLYLWITLLFLVFNMVPALMNTYAEVQEVGGPEDIWDWISLLLPLFETALMCILGYFVQIGMGTYLSRKNTAYRTAASRTVTDDTAAQNDVRIDL